MHMIEVQGGRRLAGRVTAQGAKNAVLPILAATLLTDQQVVLQRVPHIADVAVMTRILAQLGAKVEWHGDTLTVDPSGVHTSEVPEDEARQIRASNLLLGALLARLGRASVPLPGGCAIGQRRMDLHEKGLTELGARVSQEGAVLHVASGRGGLRGAAIYLDFPSVGATENIMLAAAGASGVTVIHNAAREPEVVDLAVFLNEMGASVEGAGTDRIVIYGRKLPLGGAEHAVIPDRIEAGTLLIAGAITRSRIRVEQVLPQHLEALLLKLQEMGFPLECGADWVEILPPPGAVRGVDLRTMPYPGFPTDLQPPMLSLLLTAEGQSHVTETIFESRFTQVPELMRMGARITMESATQARIPGSARLRGAAVEARDLRGAAALVLAGLAAEGTTQVFGAQYLDRGYEGLCAKLEALGAAVRLAEKPSALGSRHEACSLGSPPPLRVPIGLGAR